VIRPDRHLGVRRCVVSGGGKSVDAEPMGTGSAGAAVAPCEVFDRALVIRRSPMNRAGRDELLARSWRRHASPKG